MTKFPPYPYVAIEWLDAHSPSSIDIFDANDLKGAHGTMPVITAGWLLKDDDAGVTLASEWFAGTSEFRALTFIPRTMIAERTELAVKKVRVKKVAATGL